MILILTDESDVHADIIIEKLSLSRKPFFRFNLNVEALKKSSISYENNFWTVRQNGKEINISDVKSIWCRRTTVSLNSEEDRNNSNEFRLWKSEWNRCLFGIYSSLSGAFWLNHIRQATLADNKFYQFKFAAACGLSIPDFITSNKKEDLIKFSRIKGDVALKFMSQDLYYGNDGEVLGLYVNKISSSDIENFGDSSENPVTLQEYIEKDFEVRYTVVDGEHFACKISSQLSERANIDWRRYDVANTPHLKIIPDQSIIEKVNNLLKNLDLNYGALDFIVDKKGKWWFLEVNSAGQWLWIEDLSGLKISDSIVKCLIRHAV